MLTVDTPARPQQARELAHRLLWILDMLQTFEAGHMDRMINPRREFAVQVALVISTS